MNTLIRVLAAAQRALEARRDRRFARRRLVQANELRPGMLVLVECVVVDPPDDRGWRTAHVHVRPVHWQAGDQYLWYWRHPQRSQPTPWIEVVDG